MKILKDLIQNQEQIENLNNSTSEKRFLNRISHIIILGLSQKRNKR